MKGRDILSICLIVVFSVCPSLRYEIYCFFIQSLTNIDDLVEVLGMYS